MRRSPSPCPSLLTLALAPGSADAAAQLKSQRDKGAKEQPYLFNADQVEFDQDLGLIVAKGHVEISQGDQILLADTVTYNQHTDTATASGHVSLMQPTGDVMFADYAELHDNFKDGFVRDVRMLLARPLAARGQHRRDGSAARASKFGAASIRRAICARTIRPRRRCGRFAPSGSSTTRT